MLREWRLEEVLGVGGFGIVYKARGIYFDELVAIKEYFPSSISERDSEDTVVPIDSDAEEVHALGLKKFVEEAKLLWNLSTPTRHPNIVSVRSLFEIHGTAYMVMDFEDGMSLSRMLKQGRRFNERSLWNILQPIAEGLERAHRVGVLHRDIKPPNILINEDNRPVLIDFGSARFDDRRGDQHQGHLPHAALRGDRAICENLPAGAVDRHLCARRRDVRVHHGREAGRSARAAPCAGSATRSPRANGRDTARSSSPRSMRRWWSSPTIGRNRLPNGSGCSVKAAAR